MSQMPFNQWCCIDRVRPPPIAEDRGNNLFDISRQFYVAGFFNRFLIKAF
jgi:hypothetical protein